MTGKAFNENKAATHESVLSQLLANPPIQIAKVRQASTL